MIDDSIPMSEIAEEYRVHWTRWQILRYNLGMIAIRLLLDTFCIFVTCFVYFWIVVFICDVAGFDHPRQMVIDALMGW